MPSQFSVSLLAQSQTVSLLKWAGHLRICGRRYIRSESAEELSWYYCKATAHNWKALAVRNVLTDWKISVAHVFGRSEKIQETTGHSDLSLFMKKKTKTHLHESHFCRKRSGFWGCSRIIQDTGGVSGISVWCKETMILLKWVFVSKFGETEHRN